VAARLPYTEVMHTATKTRLTLATALLVVVTGVTARAQEAQDPANFSPVQILLTMKRAYSSCRSYRDTGKVKTRSVMEDGSYGSNVPFATAFVRNGAFRFEFTDSGLGEQASRCILWWGGSEVRSWWDAKPGVRLSESLQQGLDAASGISNGASLRVPGMLLPAEVGSGPPLVGPERIADEAIGEASCFRLTGKSRATPYTETSGAGMVTVKDETITLWIDRATYMLRKVEEARTLDTYRSTRTTTYTPEVNVDVPADQLAFNPPETATVTPPPPLPRATPAQRP
jgi:hypothetical protein